MTNPLSGKLILITGASRGIGLSISQKFAHAGGSLILVSRTKPHLDAALSTLPPGGEHQSVAGDVGDPEFWEEVRGGCGVCLLPQLVTTMVRRRGGGRARADGSGSMVEKVRCPRERCRNHALQSSDGDKIGDDTGSYQDEPDGVGVRVQGGIEGDD